MNFLDYKDELEKNGYVVTEENVTTRMGDVLAANDPYGQMWCVDSKVDEILTTKKVRARTDKGHFVKDDPSTPENEAWTTKVAKKVTKSKGKK
jgi:hypothetical protein